MRLLSSLFCLFLLTGCIFSENMLGPIDYQNRMGFHGYFDSKRIDEVRVSSYMGRFLFGPDFYTISLIIDVDRNPSHLFDYPNPLKNPGIEVGVRYDEQGTWQNKKEGPFDFVLFDSDSDYTYKEKLGMLVHPRKLLMYDKNYLLFSSDEGLRWDGHNPRVTEVRSSSYLVEGSKKYTGISSILHTTNEYIPWVEGVDGAGVGEWFEIQSSTIAWPLDFLLISNGYVDFTKPHLYGYNNRIKKMRIDIAEHDMSFEVELDDTPQLQEVRLPRKINDGETIVRFTIIDVYPGTKWDDTCLNLVIPMGDLPD